MKTVGTILSIVFFGTVASINAQATSVKSEMSLNTNQDRMSYYEQRGADDARFELEFKSKSKAEEKAFWKEQKQYEKNLKKQNRKAYRAYIASKQERYAEHYHHCDTHCHHDESFYQYAGYYYYGYDQRNYQTSPRTISVNTQIRVNTPSLRLGVF